ncbi:MAG: FixH family protein [Prolixibacteraceae bacterium]
MKKLNWGHGIFIAIAIMVLSMLALVYKVTHERVELVTEDYYPKELKFEDEIQKKKATKQLKEPITIEITDSLKIIFPLDFDQPQLIKGEIWFYRASKMSDDRRDSIHLGNNRTLTYPISDFSSGKYDIIIDWKYLGKNFYFKEPIFIDKE